MREKTNRRRRLYEVIAEAAEMPVDSVSAVPTFTVRGLHELEADGCDGILEYCDTRVVFSCRFGMGGGRRRVTVSGDKLILSVFSERVLTVHGNISSVTFTED